MKEIRLTLTKVWFVLIKSGQKTEEYRDITPYYMTRLCKNYNKEICQTCKHNYCHPEPKGDSVHFTLGYPRNDQPERHMVKRILDIRKGRGRWIWGAPNHRCFIIKLDSHGRD